MESSEPQIRAQFAEFLLDAFPPHELRLALEPILSDHFFGHITPGSPVVVVHQVVERLHQEGELPRNAERILRTLLDKRPSRAEQLREFARAWRVELPHGASPQSAPEPGPETIAECVERLDRDLRARQSASQAELLALNRRIHAVAERIRIGVGFPQAGQLRARCRLIQPLGSGSFGSVWLGDCEGVSRAVKVFHIDKLETDVMLCRFIRSIAAMRLLRDDKRCPDAIIRLHDVDLATISFSMEFAPLGTLDQPRVTDWSVEKKIDVVYRLCQAVAFAHGLGVVHRDLKPNNILLTSGDRPVVTDFDLVAFRHKDSTLGRASAVLGSLTFAAPEQLSNPHEATEQADIYSLGRLLYYLLLKRFPALALHGPTDVAEIAGVPKPYLEVIRRATERDIRRRYRSVEEMMLDIQRAQTGWAKVTTTWRRTARWMRSNLGPLGIASTLMLAGVGAVVIQARHNQSLRALNERFDHASVEIERILGEREATVQTQLWKREERCALDVEISSKSDDDPALPEMWRRRRALDRALVALDQDLAAHDAALRDWWQRLEQVRQEVRARSDGADSTMPANTPASAGLTLVPSRPEPTPQPGSTATLLLAPPPQDWPNVQKKPRARSPELIEPAAPAVMPSEQEVLHNLERVLERDCREYIQVRVDVSLQLSLIAGRLRVYNLEPPSPLWSCIRRTVEGFDIPAFIGANRYYKTVALPMTLDGTSAE